jgi:hypothetical protein
VWELLLQLAAAMHKVLSTLLLPDDQLERVLQDPAGNGASSSSSSGVNSSSEGLVKIAVDIAVEAGRFLEGLGQAAAAGDAAAAAAWYELCAAVGEDCALLGTSLQ